MDCRWVSSTSVHCRICKPEQDMQARSCGHLNTNFLASLYQAFKMSASIEWDACNSGKSANICAASSILISCSTINAGVVVNFSDWSECERASSKHINFKLRGWLCKSWSTKLSTEVPKLVSMSRVGFLKLLNLAVLSLAPARSSSRCIALQMIIAIMIADPSHSIL